MHIISIVAAGMMLFLASIEAQAGYVREWVTARGGCRASIRTLSDSLIEPNELKFLGKPSLEWTDADFEDYRDVLRDCAQQMPVVLTHTVNDPGGVILERKINEQLDLVYSVTTGRAKSERAKKFAKEKAQQDLERSQAADRREHLIEEARRAREKAESAQHLADEEAPLIADAERQYAEAAKARDEAEQRLKAVRERTQTQQRARLAEDENRMAAEAEQRRIETDARARSELAALAGKPCRVTQEQFDRVRYGMNLQQVQIAFGCLGRQSRGFRIEGLGTYTTYVFEGMNEASVISVTLRGSSLEKKEQIGLF